MKKLMHLVAAVCGLCLLSTSVAAQKPAVRDGAWYKAGPHGLVQIHIKENAIRQNVLVSFTPKATKDNPNPQTSEEVEGTPGPDTGTCVGTEEPMSTEGIDLQVDGNDVEYANENGDFVDCGYPRNTSQPVNVPQWYYWYRAPAGYNAPLHEVTHVASSDEWTTSPVVSTQAVKRRYTLGVSRVE